ncbi:hypothetical protein HZA45_03675 [Candidatus Peregrinibacteria bacterium]|nr:hypothetical protein [Candidatus Peregrinibacteria bacterium]
MQFFVSSEVFSRHPDAMIGIIVAESIDNSAADGATEALLCEAEKQVRSTLNEATFKEHPNIAAMQEIHRSFGNNPNKFPPSVQALLKRVLKGGQLPVINPLVDIYNVISLRHVVCIGAEDTDTCSGDLRLTIADGGEPFTPLGEEANDPAVAGELVYRDDTGIICRKLNWREGDRTKITEHTKNAVIVVEGFPPVTREKLDGILQELSALTAEHCRAETRIEVLTKERPECAIR